MAERKGKKEGNKTKSKEAHGVVGQIALGCERRRPSCEHVEKSRKDGVVGVEKILVVLIASLQLPWYKFCSFSRPTQASDAAKSRGLMETQQNARLQLLSCTRAILRFQLLTSPTARSLRERNERASDQSRQSLRRSARVPRLG